jgi:hypothetical protein
MPYLSRVMAPVGQQIRKILQRWVPVDGAAPRPSHKAYITGDGQMCCEWHSREFEQHARPIGPVR